MRSEREIYQKALGILTSQGRFHINLGLERIEKIIEVLDNPHKKLKYIHVAGTNGKGSVCSMLSSILIQSGYKIGLFTSPHVFEYTERIKINDKKINKKLFAKKIIRIINLSEENNLKLTEFEILTALAFEYFKENKVDIVVLETGLGGRLDATNVIDKNLCSIITSIDFDHTERLGNTIEKISFEKGGIIKKNCPVVISKNNLGLDVIKKIAKEKNTKILTVKEGRNFLQENSALKGTYQGKNLLLVLKALEILEGNGFKISKKAVKEGLKKVNHPCRFEFYKKNILIDAAHNPSGIKALRESLDKSFPDKNFRFIFGCLRNKNYPQMLENLFSPGDEVFFYKFDNPNSCSFRELQSSCHFKAKPFEKFDKSDKLTVICGSLYMIKELLSKIATK